LSLNNRPTKVIEQTHRLAKAIEEHEKKLFTDMNGDIITDHGVNDDDNNETAQKPIIVNTK